MRQHQNVYRHKHDHRHTLCVFPFVHHYIITFSKSCSACFECTHFDLLLCLALDGPYTGPYTDGSHNTNRIDWHGMAVAIVRDCVYVSAPEISLLCEETERSVRLDIIYQFIFGSCRLALHIYL